MAKLSEIPAPFGFEDRMIPVIVDCLKPYVDEVKVDNLGNVAGIRKGTSDKAPKIMIAAHMDECGFIVKYIEDDGFIRFYRLGFTAENILHARRVLVHTRNGTVRGVVGVKCYHLLSSAPPEKRREVQPIEEMYIDVGASSRKEAEMMGIRVGDIVTFDEAVVRHGQTKLVSGKAMDDRIGLVIMLEALKRLSKLRHEATIYAVATVQEEVGSHGAKTSAFALNPDMAIALDITVSGDTPETQFKEAPIKMGSGPAIKIMDLIPAAGLGLVAQSKVRDLLFETAKELGIPHQPEVLPNMSTDASVIQSMRSGIPSCVISVPCRYAHTPVEMINLDDVENAIRLLTSACEKVTSKFSLSKYP